MKIKTLFIFQAIVSFLNGFTFLIAPALYLSLFGISDPFPETILMSRLLGAALFGYSVISWLARDLSETIGRKAIVAGLFVGNFAGLIGMVMGQLAGIPNMMGWSIVGLYLVLALAFGYFMLVPQTD